MVFLICCLFFGFFLFIFVHIPCYLTKETITWGYRKKIEKDQADIRTMLVKELEKDGYLEAQRMRERIKEEEKKINSNKNILRTKATIAEGAVLYSDNLKAKYPFANKGLFEICKNRFPYASRDELNKLEREIKSSHELNYKPPKAEVKLTLKDIENLTPIEEHKELPILLRVYKVDNLNYAIYFKDLDSGYTELLTSNDYVLIVKTIDEIVEKQKQLSNAKSKVSSSELKRTYDNVSKSINQLRETGVMTI